MLVENPSQVRRGVSVRQCEPSGGVRELIQGYITMKEGTSLINSQQYAHRDCCVDNIEFSFLSCVQAVVVVICRCV